MYAYFEDSGDPIVDILGTSEYEGVTVTAYLGDSEVPVLQLPNLTFIPRQYGLTLHYEFKCK